MILATRKSKPVDYAAGFLDAIKDLGKEKGIAPEILFDAIEAALISAYKRNFGSAQNVEVVLDRDRGTYHVYAIKVVTEDPDNDVTQRSLGEARAIHPAYDVGSEVRIEVTPANFGRIAAQTAK